MLVKIDRKMERGKKKAKTKEESVHHEDLDDIDEYLAFMSRRFSKLKFKRNPAVSKINSQLQKKQSTEQVFC